MPESPTDSIIRRNITGVELSHLFFEISNEIGYTHDIAGTYVTHLQDLMDLWAEQGFVEIYSDDADRAWGRVKDSNSVRGSTPWYMGLYHARIQRGENDPLAVVVFEQQTEEGVSGHKASIRFMLDHDDMFGVGSEKFNPARMREIRARIYEFIKEAGLPSLMDEAS
ncbi:TPA: hypothetical protein L6B64_07070 [Pseudomonas aeruginosa]|uniref:hypothetical protein n=1 Tax=Pseudomonas TaxID=286 RepID=UPI000734CAF2|nr:hypothetical protein [Pseudomonas parafulva]KTT00828.1 hypothetical protein NS212_05570 [Pseudomonas parafulva]HBP5426599.1 hypothetical protein [Pseudomonas aeruginosa]HEQ1717498.1 hypothetical protein [Pseudomonas aeruginosa]